MNPKIVWQKWYDPYGDDIEDNEWNEAIIDSQKNQNEEVQEDYEQKVASANNIQQNVSQVKKPMKLMFTPMGIIPITEYSTPSKVFNFWMAHTNFDITPKINSLIEKSEGVETLDVFTRYRLRIGIGKAFDTGKVMRQINASIAQHLETSNGRP